MMTEYYAGNQKGNFTFTPTVLRTWVNPNDNFMCTTDIRDGDIERNASSYYNNTWNEFGWGNSTQSSLNNYLIQLGQIAWQNETLMSVNSTYSIPTSARDHNILIVSMRRYGVGGTSIIFKPLVTEGAYASGCGIISAGATNQYWKFTVDSNYVLKLTEKGSSLGDPYVVVFGIY